jgi:uncharacterized protein YfaS (alpha-2-macroglobulin family)
MEGVKAGGDTRRTVSVPRGARVPVTFEVKAEEPGSAKFSFRAELGSEKDAVAVTLPVERPSPMETLTLMEGSTRSVASTEVVPPKSAIPGEGVVDLTIDGSGLAGATEGLRYLVEYPYGCLEQTTTRVVPLVALHDLAESLDLDDLKGSRLDEFIRAGVAKILRFQSEGGGFSLWVGGTPESYLTAFALFGLHGAKQAGFEVPDEPVERGLRTLRADIASGKFSNPYHQEIMGETGAHAFALYVLALWKHPEPGIAAKMFAERETLPRYGKAFLARALAIGGGDPKMVETLVADMTLGQTKKGDGLVLPEPAGEALAYYFSDDSRSTALVLQALLEVAPGHAMTDSLVRGLLASRQEGRWQSTQSNFYGLSAMAAYANSRGARETPVDVKLGERKLFAGKVGGRSLRRMTMPLAEAKGPLEVATSGQSVFYAAHVRYTPRPETLSPVAHGFELRRELLDPDTGAVVTSPRVGQMVRVRVTVSSRETRYRVAVVERLPAGLEYVSQKTEHDGPRDWRRGFWSHIEAHDDRVEAFSEVMWNGTSSFEFLARATTAGTFVRPPATVEEMYRPQNHARTALESIAILARP